MKTATVQAKIAPLHHLTVHLNIFVETKKETLQQIKSQMKQFSLFRIPMKKFSLLEFQFLDKTLHNSTQLYYPSSYTSLPAATTRITTTTILFPAIINLILIIFLPQPNNNCNLSRLNLSNILKISQALQLQLKLPNSLHSPEAILLQLSSLNNYLRIQIWSSKTIQHRLNQPVQGLLVKLDRKINKIRQFNQLIIKIAPFLLANSCVLRLQ